jgi:hypothetical protein
MEKAASNNTALFSDTLKIRIDGKECSAVKGAPDITAELMTGGDAFEDSESAQLFVAKKQFLQINRDNPPIAQTQIEVWIPDEKAYSYWQIQGINTGTGGYLLDISRND